MALVLTDGVQDRERVTGQGIASAVEQSLAQPVVKSTSSSTS